MQLTKWDPFREMEDVFDRYTRAIGWPRRGRSQEVLATGDWAPRVRNHWMPLIRRAWFFVWSGQ